MDNHQMFPTPSSESRLTDCDDGRIVSTFENFVPTITTPPDILLPSPTSNNGNISNSNNFANNNFLSEAVRSGGDGSLNTQNISPRRTLNTSIPTFQTHISKINSTKLLSLTINKDSNGYGMKVSGDNPVYVESVKNGGASEKAGLVAGDMILKVNGNEVRSETHKIVVNLIKSQPIVNLTVKRQCKLPKSTQLIGPQTSLIAEKPRDRTASITAPQPVDNAKRKEMEVEKIATLKKMLVQEQNNLKKASSNNSDYKRSEANIAKLQEQLKQVEKECHMKNQPTNFLTPVSTSAAKTSIANSSPAFLSLLPRSLSSLSLGNKKKIDKDSTSNVSATSEMNCTHHLSQSMHNQRPSPHQQHIHSYPSQPFTNITPGKKKFSGSQKNLKEETPPPLPQRNIPRNIASEHFGNDWRRSTIISDLDHSIGNTVTQTKRDLESPSRINHNSNSHKRQQRTKSKTKALSDPKMSTQMFLLMEKGENGEGEFGTPPPLPPRQPGMMEECNLNNKRINNIRPSPNSIETQWNYPLVTTCQAIRDNGVSAFPLSQRSNIFHPLKQQPNSKTIVSGQHLPSSNNASKQHRRVVSSPDNISKSISDTLEKREAEVTPPGTPPPPYLSQHNSNDDNTDHILSECMIEEIILKSENIVIPTEIISMEEEELSDQDVLDVNTPFALLPKLLDTENIVYLAIFLNFLLSNSDPTPLLFYLITDLFKEGNLKELRKWAYEIHSTFLVPSAPLAWFNVDESLINEVDMTLQQDYDKSELMKKVFLKSRKKAKEKITEQLRDFQVKRIAGLGTIYGPSDANLAEAKGDKLKEHKIFEETVLPKLQILVDELDKESSGEESKKVALCSALATILFRIFFTRSNPSGLCDRVQHFVSRQKGIKTRMGMGMGKKGKVVIQGHPLILKQYYEVTHCNQCQTIIWGVSPQGYHCTDCKLNIHRPCSKKIEEYCPGPVPQKRKEQQNDNKISKIIGIIRPSHPVSQNEKRLKDDEPWTDDIVSTSDLNPTITRQLSDRRTDTTNLSLNPSSSTSFNVFGEDNSQANELNTTDCAQDADKDIKRDRSKAKSAPGSVNRSESYRDREHIKIRNRNTRRKISDPSLTNKTTDEHSEYGISNATWRSSSSSLSSSGSRDGSNMSLDRSNIANQSSSINFSTNTGQASFAHDSDIDDDNFSEADWSSHVPTEVLSNLSDIEKKRQEIINEIYQTERSHVRTLRLLEKIFMKPLQESNVLPSEHLLLLFPPALLSLKDLHSSFEQKLKIRRIENDHVVRSMGDLLVLMFEGQSGEKLREYAVQFCSRQQIALEALKEKRRKDEHLNKILIKAELDKACRRLQLKDLLPTVLQRLTKYPLLFENLLKISKRLSAEDESELDCIKRALDSSKRILVDVNQAVKTAEDEHKLLTIQQRLDKSSFEKENKDQYKNLDLTKHKLIHDGHLTLKKSGVQLHGLLFENMMVLLHKQDDKYVLKNFPNLSITEQDKNKSTISPITNIDQQTLVRQSAVDKNTFFLIITKASQMLELRAPSSSECKIWFKHISDVAEQYKPRSKNSTTEQFEDIGSTTLPHSNTKESLESTPERTNSNASSFSQNKNVSDEQDDIPPPLPLPQKNNADRGDMLLRSASKKSSDNDYVNSSLLDDSNDQSKRDSNSYLCSNNSNETRTLMQDCQLQEPTAVQISVSSVHTAEPILTQSELLKRLDIRINKTLSEKLKIICDMFRIPVEHYHEIVDIVEQPEAPKDCSDIILAAYAQMQTLTETLNEFTKVTPEQKQQIQASMSLCDKCHAKQIPLDKSRSVISTNLSKTLKPDSHSVEKNRLSEQTVNSETYHEDDDGYCELAEVRSSGFQKPTSISESACGSSSSASQTHNTSSPTEILKRQSLISVDSIPEESENEIQETESLVMESLADCESVDGVENVLFSMENAISSTSDITACNLSKQNLCGPTRLTQSAVNTELSIPFSSINTSVLKLNTYITQLMVNI
ncbi:ARHGEF12 family protein [Megaselia abdita]